MKKKKLNSTLCHPKTIMSSFLIKRVIKTVQSITKVSLYYLELWLFFRVKLAVWSLFWIDKFLSRVSTSIMNHHTRYLRIVPAFACASNTMMEASSRLIDVDKCERAAMWRSSSKTNSSSSCDRSCDLQ